MLFRSDADDYRANVFSWLRRGADGSLVAVAVNMSPVPRVHYRLGLPVAGEWEEVLNTDAIAYGGTGSGNLGLVLTVDEPWHGRPVSASIVVPPLAAVWLRHRG